MKVKVYGTEYDLEDFLKDLLNDVESLKRDGPEGTLEKIDELENKVSELEERIEDIKTGIKGVIDDLSSAIGRLKDF